MAVQQIRARLNWREAIEGVPLSYANQFMVQTTGNEFLISVAQVSPPGLIDPTPEEIAEVTTIMPTVLFRFAVGPDNMKALISHLQDQFEKYESRISAAEGQPEGT